MLLQLLLFFLVFMTIFFFFTNSYIELWTKRLWPVHVTTRRSEKMFSVRILLQFKIMTQNYLRNQQKPAHYYFLHTLLTTYTCVHTNMFPLSSLAGGYLRRISPHLPTPVLVRVRARTPLPVIPFRSLLLRICLI